MFGKKSESMGVGRIDSLLGAGARIEGNIIFSGGLRVDGEVKGDVKAAPDSGASTLVLSEHARIEGGVAVGHLVINGVVVGPVHVSGLLEMQGRAKIIGDVSYAVIEMHQGAVIEGRLLHLSEQTAEKPA